MYALEAARLVRHLPIEFTFTGGSWLDQGVIEWPDNCKLQAPVPRTKVSEIFSANDVFLFPTLSDGFGIVQLEAICRGLPVIATPCCGDVVEDGVSGFIVPSRDAQSIVNALVQLLVPERLEAMSAAAHLRAGEFSPERILPQYRHTLTTTTIQPALFDVAR
jgi:glycosyltransferase involved in cell wall biosynthesis